MPSTTLDNTSTLLTVGAVGAAAQSQVVPAGFDARPANSLSPILVGSPESRVQMVYDLSDFSVSQFTKEIAFRVPTGPQYTNIANLAVSVPMIVTISHSPRFPYEVAMRFADNVGSDARLVFQGTVNWPAAAWSSAMPFVARIPVSTFVVQKTTGKSLVIDVRTGVYTWGVPWLVDVAGPFPIPAETNFVQSSRCTDSQGNQVLNFHVFPQDTAIGGRFAPRFYKCPASSLGLIAIGTKRVPDAWNNKPLPHQVPSTYCMWATDTLFVLGFTTDAQGWGHAPERPIPFDRRLAGFKFCVQPAFADAKANALGWFTSASMCFEIVNAPAAAMVEAVGQPVPDVGSRRIGWGIVTRLSQ